MGNNTSVPKCKCEKISNVKRACCNSSVCEKCVKYVGYCINCGNTECESCYIICNCGHILCSHCKAKQCKKCLM